MLVPNQKIHAQLYLRNYTFFLFHENINGFKVNNPPVFSGKFNSSMIFICYTANRPRFQKSAYYGSIKIFNSLPASLKMSMKRIILKQQ
jgi:hypothetical protein